MWHWHCAVRYSKGVSGLIVAIPIFFSETDIQHCETVVVFKVTDTWKWNLKYIFAKSTTKLQRDSDNGTKYLANIQNLVCNMTVDDHTAWPTCLQCCDHCDVNFSVQLIHFYNRNGRWKSGGCFLFSISHFYKTASRVKNGSLVVVFYFPYLKHITVKPGKPVGWAHALTMRSHISIMKDEPVGWAHDVWTYRRYYIICS